jgi:hypothetical protein
LSARTRMFHAPASVAGTVAKNYSGSALFHAYYVDANGVKQCLAVRYTTGGMSVRKALAEIGVRIEEAYVERIS